MEDGRQGADEGQVSPARHAIWVVVAVVALAASLAANRGALTAAPGAPGDLPRDVRDAQLTFGPSVTGADRQAVIGAIAAARPEARALIARVDGLVTVEVGPTGQPAVGLTSGNRDGYQVILDLAPVLQRSGGRGLSRLVLHELGHVVDHALLDPARQRSLDAGIPLGYACRPGESTGACATREERFAETFAKWASGDIGVNVSLGYKVLPPPDLEAWGAGLAGI